MVTQFNCRRFGTKSASYLKANGSQVALREDIHFDGRLVFHQQLESNIDSKYIAATTVRSMQSNYTRYAADHGVIPSRAACRVPETNMGSFGFPALEKHRDPYSITKSTPETPYDNAIVYPDNSTHISAMRGSLFCSTPPPQQLSHAMYNSLRFKSIPYVESSIPVDVYINIMIIQPPAIPQAVPAVFAPQENMRTLEQSPLTQSMVTAMFTFVVFTQKPTMRLWLSMLRASVPSRLPRPSLIPPLVLARGKIVKIGT